MDLLFGFSLFSSLGPFFLRNPIFKGWTSLTGASWQMQICYLAYSLRKPALLVCWAMWQWGFLVFWWSACRSQPCVPVLSRTKGWSGMLGSRHGHSLSSLQYRTSPPCSRLNVSMSQCLLVCCAMKWSEGVRLWPWSNANMPPFFSGGRMHFGVLLGGIGRSECCRTRGAFHALAKLTWMNSSISITYVFFSLYL